MTITDPGMYGLIVRKTERTRKLVEEQRRRHELMHPGYPMNEDEGLLGFSVAMSWEDLELAVQALERDGLTEGLDFVTSSSHSGLLKPAPDWLGVGLSPTGNPPDLEAKMEPEIRAMWERSRRRIYWLQDAA